MIVQLSANETRKNKYSLRTVGWDWTAVSLLLACVLVASGRLAATEATDHLFLVSFLAILGCVAGLALGYARFRTWLSAILGLAYGAFFVPWQLGLALFADQEWTVRLRDLGGRLGFAIGQFTSGQNVEDPLLFIVTMSVLFWLFGLNAGFRMARYGDIWGALIPFGLAALVVQGYDAQVAWRSWLLALFLLCLLLLLARINYLKNRHDWDAKRTSVPYEISGSLSTMAFGFAVTLVLLAWATPALASSLDSVESLWSSITSPWRAIRDELGRALFTLEGESFSNGNVFGEQFAMGRGIPQSPDILFNVQIIQQDQLPNRYYWRDRVYDHYEDGRWSGSFDGFEVWQDAIEIDEQIGRSLTEFLFTMQVSTDLLHAAAQPLELNRAAEISFAPNEDGTQDVDALFAQSPVLPGESYDLAASIAVPTANQLRESGTEYPDWVTKRYLQLPQDFSLRMQELALSLTEDEPTAYDKTVAITNFLRAELEYVDRIAVPPFDRDPVEWALFDQKQGFCNYYASAEVLMLRSLGIPARLAVGYAQGERDDAGGRTQYVVRVRDAHAWPEVYFAGIGWVEFEPTANQSPLTRPANNPNDELSEEELLRLLREELTGPIESDQTTETQEIRDVSSETVTKINFSWLRSLLAVLALLGLGVAFAWNWDRVQERVSIPELLVNGFTKLDLAIPDPVAKWERYSKLTNIERAYMEISVALTRLGRTPRPGDTPQQRSDSLARLLPSLKEEIQTLSRDYQFRSYSRSKVSRDERALKTMKHIRWTARREQLRVWLGNFGKPTKKM